MAQVAQKWRQDAAMLANLEPKMVILDHFSDLERDLSKNSRSVKTTNTTTLFVVFRGSGARLEGPLGAILDDVGSRMVSFGLS